MTWVGAAVEEEMVLLAQCIALHSVPGVPAQLRRRWQVLARRSSRS